MPVAKLFLVADVPASVTIVVAIVTAVTGVLGGVLAASRQAASTLAAARAQSEATITSAEKQSGASVLNAESERFAAWQMHKRSVYASFIGAARNVSQAPGSSEARDAYLTQGDQVLLVASKDLRDRLQPLLNEPEQLSDPVQWRTLVEELGADARKPKPGD